MVLLIPLTTVDNQNGVINYIELDQAAWQRHRFGFEAVLTPLPCYIYFLINDQRVEAPKEKNMFIQLVFEQCIVRACSLRMYTFIYHP